MSERGYVGPVAHRIDFDAQRDPMFQDDQGNGWVPLATFHEVSDDLARERERTTTLREALEWFEENGAEPQRYVAMNGYLADMDYAVRKRARDALAASPPAGPAEDEMSVAPKHDWSLGPPDLPDNPDDQPFA